MGTGSKPAQEERQAEQQRQMKEQEDLELAMRIAREGQDLEEAARRRHQAEQADLELARRLAAEEARPQPHKPKQPVSAPPANLRPKMQPSESQVGGPNHLLVRCAAGLMSTQAIMDAMQPDESFALALRLDAEEKGKQQRLQQERRDRELAEAAALRSELEDQKRRKQEEEDARMAQQLAQRLAREPPRKQVRPCHHCLLSLPPAPASNRYLRHWHPKLKS